MESNFNTQTTSVFRSLKIWSFPLFKHSGILSQLFFYLFIISLAVVGFSFYGLILVIVAVKMSVFFLLFFIVSLEIYLFTEFKIKRPKFEGSLSKTLLDGTNYNLAEFLSFQTCKIVEDAVALCKQKKLPVVLSEALFYTCIVQSQYAKILIFRFGIDSRKLLEDLNNYLEKSRQKSSLEPESKAENKKFSLLFSESFEKVIEESAVIANERGKETIGEKEILVALSRRDEFFKKLLMEYDLKEVDVENVTKWLDAVEEKINERKKFWNKENLLRLGSLGKDWSSGFTVLLDQFSIDWRAVSSKHVLNELVGHKKEIEELEIVLSKSGLSNALIVGEPGIGKKSIIKALAQRCYFEQSLPDLNDKRVVELDMVSLLTRIQDPEKLETTIDQIFEEAVSSGNVILVIDKLDNFALQKVQKPGAVDISGILGKYLSLPNFKFIGITSFDGLHRKLEESPAFLEYFRKIEVSEVSELETIKILQNLTFTIEQKYNIFIVYPSIREIVNLTSRYFPSTPFPKKAIDILDESAAYVKSLKEKVILPHHIAKIISDKAEIPVGKMEFKEKQVLLNLENLIHEKIINQEEAVKEISIAMRRARSGISSKKRPMGSFLFLGPTGVGKTETAKALAEIYFGGQEKIITLDMSEFQSISDIPRLLGATSPVEEQGLLTTPVREKPFSLVLLDEIEKAHPNILNLLLQVLDEGHITDGQGRKIIFTNTIIICTSNAGAELIFQEVESGKKVQRSELLDFLFEKRNFRPEFINRFDAVVMFHPLSKENLLDISQLMLTSLAKNLKEKDINLIITDSLRDKIVELSYKPEFGAREMRRVMQDNIENTIAQALLSDQIVKGDTIEISSENFEVIKIEK